MSQASSPVFFDRLTNSDYIGDPSQHTGLYAFGEIDALNMLMVPGVTTRRCWRRPSSGAKGDRM
jgi:hypothetical protein